MSHEGRKSLFLHRWRCEACRQAVYALDAAALRQLEADENAQRSCLVCGLQGVHDNRRCRICCAIRKELGSDADVYLAKNPPGVPFAPPTPAYWEKPVADWHTTPPVPPIPRRDFEREAMAELEIDPYKIGP